MGFVSRVQRAPNPNFETHFLEFSEKAKPKMGFKRNPTWVSNATCRVGATSHGMHRRAHRTCRAGHITRECTGDVTKPILGLTFGFDFWV